MYKVLQYILLTIIGLLVAVGIHYIFFNSIAITNNNEKDNDKPKEIIKYEINNNENIVFDDYNMFCIDSITELNLFNNVYKKLEIDENIFNNNTVFVKLLSLGSEVNNAKLSVVDLNNNSINFLINTNNFSGDEPTSYYTWYFVAIIPKEMIINYNLDNWVKPSSIYSYIINEKERKLLFSLEANTLKCHSPKLYVYDDNSYEYYYTYSTNNNPLVSKTGTYNYDINTIIDSIPYNEVDKTLAYTITINDENHYISRYDLIDEFLSSIDINLNVCLINQD